MNMKAMISAFQARRQIQHQAEQVLTQHAGGPVSLRFSNFIRTPSVCRLRVRASPIELGESVIMKGIRYFEDRTGVEARYPAPRWMFFNDRAGLQFLQQGASDSLIVPHLYASSHQPALLFMQDLKPVAHLGTFLQGRNGRLATNALTQWGAALGKLHAQTIGKPMAFNMLRDALAPRSASWSWVNEPQTSMIVWSPACQHCCESRDLRAFNGCSGHFARLARYSRCPAQGR